MLSYRGHGDLPRLHRWAGASAVVTALLFTVGNTLWGLEQPERGASGRELVGFYGDASDRIVVGGALSLLGIAALVLFAAALRGVLVELEDDDLLGNVAFGGALLGCAAGLGAETINMAAALRAGHGELTQPLAQALFDISWVLGYNGAGIGLGLLALATGATALRSRLLLPRWLAVGSLVLGAALLTPLMLTPLGLLLLVLAVAQVLIVGVMLLRGSAVRGPRKLAAGADTSSV